jgi:hypothetical protein
MRSDAALSRLTQSEQDTLFDWLCTHTYDWVLKQVALPPPEGFGLRTHINSLARFYQQRFAQIRERDFQQLLAQKDVSPGDASISARSSGAELFYSNAEASLAHLTYLLSQSPPSIANFRAIARVLKDRDETALKQEFIEISRQQLDLGRQRLQFDRTQFEYNAARAAIALLPDLVAIDGARDIDDEAKIWKVRDRLFGASPSNPQKEESK